MQDEYVSGFVQGFAAGWSGFCKDQYSFRTNLKNNDEKSSDYAIGFNEGLARGQAYAKMPSELVG